MVRSHGSAPNNALEQTRFARRSPPPVGWVCGPDTYAIITTEPNELVAPIHDRMPVILASDDEALWLDSAVTDPPTLLGCLRPYHAQEMEAYQVGPLVSSAWNEGPELVEPVSISQGRLWLL